MRRKCKVESRMVSNQRRIYENVGDVSRIYCIDGSIIQEETH